MALAAVTAVALFDPPRLLRSSAAAVEAWWHLDQSRELEKGEVLGTSDAWAITFGGKLYDDWTKVLGVAPPRGTHPLYPAAGKKSGAATWRCKECHGWDYKGAAGAYGEGDHYTGIDGVARVAGRDPKRIAAMIVNRRHGFGEDTMPAEALEKLTLFLSRGQLDMDRYIDRGAGTLKGDPQRGAALFQTICANCHGLDGREINFGDEGAPEYVGTVARENPWEALHKIRNGQPGARMVSLGAVSVEDQLNVLSYARTLPAE
jgi:thiosulfate dehydrogenase